MVRMGFKNEEAYEIAYHDVMKNKTFESQQEKMHELFILRAEHDIQRDAAEHVIKVARRIALHFEMGCAPQHYADAIDNAISENERVWISPDLMAELIQAVKLYHSNSRY